MASPVYILGGYQTDFKRNWAREGKEIFDLFKDTLDGGLAETKLDASEIETAHVGNFASEMFLGGFFAAADPKLTGIPAGRHEGACASGSLAALGASAEIEAGRYGLAAVLGIEVMRNVPGDQAAANIGPTAMWAGHECLDVRYPWPHMFSEVAKEYDNRFGLKREHLAGIAQINFANARRNPNAQTRAWTLDALSFSEDDEANPVIEGRMRKRGSLAGRAATSLAARVPRSALTLGSFACRWTPATCWPSGRPSSSWQARRKLRPMPRSTA